LGLSLVPEEFSNNCKKMTHMSGMNVFSLQILHKARSLFVLLHIFPA
jgi:hypothetical protein